MMQAPNMSFQATEADAAVMMKGADRLIPALAHAVPRLCMGWVMISCKRSSAECNHRHYYISEVSSEKRRK